MTQHVKIMAGFCLWLSVAGLADVSTHNININFIDKIDKNKKINFQDLVKKNKL